MTDTKWWAHPYGQPKTLFGPFSSREEAIRTVFTTNDRAEEVTSGYGAYGPHFDIRWMRRDKWEASR